MHHLPTRHLVSAVALSLLFLVASCDGGSRSLSDLQSSPLYYATNLTCERGEGYNVWSMRNPWDTAQVLHRYVLVHDKETTLPAALTEATATSIIPVPVSKAGVATSVHCGLMDELGVVKSIAGVCEKQYIDLPAIKEGLAAGTIADFGNGMNPNVECIMDVGPDVLLLTPFEHSGGYGRVERLGIPIVECAEYMESSPLARAEWILFYGELFGAEEQADSIFRGVEANYLAMKRQTDSLRTTRSTSADAFPKLLTELPYGGQWFVPGGQSTMGILFADAGADYIFADLPGSGSTALSFESVLDKAQDADIWLVKYNGEQPLTYRQLASDYQPYTRFRAFQQRHIFGCDLAHNHFYEQTPFHPDRLLRDLIILLHPHLLPGELPVYYKPLSE